MTFTLDAQDRETAFLTWMDGYDKMVLKAVRNPGCQPLEHEEIQSVFDLVAAAPDMLAALKDVEASGLVQCCCSRPNGECEGTCTITLVRKAIMQAEGACSAK